MTKMNKTETQCRCQTADCGCAGEADRCTCATLCACKDSCTCGKSCGCGAKK